MRPLRLGIVLAVMVSLATGCSNPKGEVLVAKPKPAGLEGRMFFLAGESGATSDLYEGDFAPGLLLYRLTTTQRIGGISGCKTDLTVTNADRSAGFTDTIQSFAGGTLSVLPGLGDSKGSGPATAPDCRLVFDQFDRGTEPPTDHLMLLEPGAKAEREVYAPGPGKVLGIADWGPDGRVAVFEGTDPTEGHPTVATGIVIIKPDGSKRVMPSPVGSFGTLQWSASKWLAIGDADGKKTVFLDPDTGARNELPGWLPLAWSPDGQHLMVTDSKERKALALVDAADLTTARVVGHAKNVSFFDLVWLTSDATAGGPPPTGRRSDDGDGP
jgi:hypothetical protein